jgi:hypothetical protein
MPIDFNLVNNPLCQTRSNALLKSQKTTLTSFPSSSALPNINDIVADINSSITLFADDTSLYMIVDDPVDAAETLNTDLAKIFVIRSTCLPQFPSLDMVRPKCLCSDTMLMILLSIMSGG